MRVLFKFILLLFILQITVSVSGQVTSKEKRYRKKMLKKAPSGKTPLIIVDSDTSRTLTPEEFLTFSDSIDFIYFSKVKPEWTRFLGERALNGVIWVKTVNYSDSIFMEQRKCEVYNYRSNELFCFYGTDAPLILFGGKEISREEFLELPEDTVAFINYYTSDFVKRKYAPKGKAGVVYVCPRKKKHNFKYKQDVMLSMPSNGRNYIDLYTQGLGFYSVSPPKELVTAKMEEYADKVDCSKDITVFISCVINTEGEIKPLLVERVEKRQEISETEQEAYIEVANKIIESMPLAPIRASWIYYRDPKTSNLSILEDLREISVSIPIKFGT